jgi:hypothetical protein
MSGLEDLQLTFLLHFFPPKQECRIFLTFFTTRFRIHFDGFWVMMASLSEKNSLKIIKNEVIHRLCTVMHINPHAYAHAFGRQRRKYRWNFL